ncbi:MAG: sorbosone dehydrogenase family protein [Chloroflexota bacterium]|nr:sorbosone dehydrogenase family protein [Chloroflexota bacterium]
MLRTRRLRAGLILVAVVLALGTLGARFLPEIPGSPLVAAQAGRVSSLQLPPGFRIETFASDLPGVRFMTIGPNGELYATLVRRGEIVRVPDRDGDGRADGAEVVAEGLNAPHGIVFHYGALYVGETNRVSRLTDADGDGVYEGHEVLADLPSGRGHSARTLGFGPDGMLYVSVGSSCNVCNEEDERRAAILQMAPDGSGARIYARGLRNAVGFVFHPATGELWATNNGRDMLGDDEPPETINVVHDGDDFGWPRCINGTQPDPQFGSPGACDGVARPVVEMQAHSAPLGLRFYEGTQFPPEYQGDLFVAFHGSWNRSIPTGYKVVRIPIEDGRPAGPAEDFVTGWQQGESRGWGRPVDLVVGSDGSLFISDDATGQIYRAWYAG